MNTNAILAVIVIAVAGIGGWAYFNQPKGTPPRETTPAPSVSTPSVPQGNADLMTPSPLGEMALGNEDAPVTIVEYASLTCPHCANFHEKVLPELKKRYIDTGKVRFIFREFPRDDVDLFAYMLTRCIGKDKFFPFVEALFQQQDKWAVRYPLPPLTAIAKQAGFTDESIEACSKDKKVQEGVIWSGENGAKLGVDSTPTVFINGKKYTGGHTIEEVEKVIASHLKS